MSREEEMSAVELEQVVGLNSDFPQCVCVLNSTQLVSSSGTMLVIRDFDSLQSESPRLLRGHSERVCALSLSVNQSFLASAQLATKALRDASAVILWDVASLQRVRVFDQCKGDITHVSFTPDSRMLAAIDSSGVFHLWDVLSGETIVTKGCGIIPSSLLWTEVINAEHRHPVYKCVIGQGTSLVEWTLEYNIHLMDYSLSESKFRFPMKFTLAREYTSLIRAEPSLLLATTNAAEIFAFDMNSRHFVDHWQVGSKQCNCVCSQGSLVFVGCVDGTIKVFDLNDTSKSVLQTLQINGSVTSVQLIAKGTRLLVSSSESEIYSVDCNPSGLLSKETILFQGNSSGESRLQRGSEISHICAVLHCDKGRISIWNLSSYLIISQVRTNRATNTFCFTKNEESKRPDEWVIAGHKDGSLSCHSWVESAQQVWRVSQAHRGGVTALMVSDSVLLSCGADSTLSVWSLLSRQQIATFNLLIGTVQGLIVDCWQPYLVHLFGESRQLCTFSMKKETVETRRQLRYDHFTSLCQVCSESEEQSLVTTTNRGKICVWDSQLSELEEQIVLENHKDESEDESSSLSLNCCSLSSKARMLAVGGSDQLVRLLDWKSRQMIGAFEGHDSEIIDLIWTVDDRQIISLDKYGSLCVWNVYCQE